MKRLLTYFSTKMIIVVAIAMIGIHIIVLVLYTQEHKSNLYMTKRHTVIQQILNAAHMMEATPRNELASAVRALDLERPNIDFSLDSYPKWRPLPQEIRFPDINELVPPKAHIVSFSLRSRDARWLNIEATIGRTVLWPQLILLLLEAITVLIVFLYVWSINRFTQPLKQFRKAADRLGVDLKTTPLEEYQGPKVIRETAQAMNKMQQRIHDLLKDRTLMLAAISHDLRTPLTRLKLRANFIQDKEIYKKTVRDLDEMETMISELLSFASHDDRSEQATKIDFNSFMQAICDDLVDLDYQITFKALDKRIPLQAYPIMLRRAFTNLIQNAIKYGEQALVSLAHKNKQIIVTITDNGPGIPEKELQDVFSPFYRCDRSRSRTIGGTGLGLTIALDAIKAHGGTIQLNNREQGGLCAIVSLPERL